MNKEAHWYGLNMLPLYFEMSEGQLNSSCEQLENLQKIPSKLHILDNATLDRIIKLHSSQNADNWVFFEQCKKWRDENPNEEELKLIAQVEKSAYELEQVNQEILKLANSFKGVTIDSLLTISDAELGLEFLLKINNER